MIPIGKIIDTYLIGKANTLIILEEDMNQNLIKQMLTGSAMLKSLYVMILFCFSLCTVLITMIWFKFRENLIWAYELCGCSFWSRIYELAKRFYLITLSAFTVGTVCLYGISAGLKEIQVRFLDVIMALSLTLGLGTAIMAVLVFWKMCKSKKYSC